MGVQNTGKGISTQLVKANGDPDGISVYFEFAELFGAARNTVIRAGGLTQNEMLTDGGSDDWLTVVVLADTRAKLDAILQEPGIKDAPQEPFQTSGSSYRVQVEMHLEDKRQSLTDRITIAEGKIISTNPLKMEIVSLKVLPPETVLNDQHPLTELFRRQIPRLE
jgi:hypothetical protein